MKIVGIVPLPPDEVFDEHAKINFPPDVPFGDPDGNRIGTILEMHKTEDGTGLEIVVELDEGVDILDNWIEYKGD